MILGSRALVIKDETVLLVKMTYIEGWYLPGGGVDKGESFVDAVRRELREECCIDSADVELFGLYSRVKPEKTDHVAVYLVRSFESIPACCPDGEILDSSFFPFDRLPTDVSPASLRRIREYLGNEIRSHSW